MKQASTEESRLCSNQSLRILVSELVDANRENLGHVHVDSILFVAGAARRSSRASIRPLSYGGCPVQTQSSDGKWAKPIVYINGIRMLYEICLRPRFFLDSTPDERATTIAHELWHISPSFDGTLASHRRHGTDASTAFNDSVAILIARWRESEPNSMGWKWLNYHGEMTMNAWLSRPPSRTPAASAIRVAYNESDLCSAVVVQTPGRETREP